MPPLGGGYVSPCDTPERRGLRLTAALQATNVNGWVGAGPTPRRRCHLDRGRVEDLCQSRPNPAPTQPPLTFAGAAANVAAQRSPGAFAGLTDTGIERSSAVRMIRVCSCVWAAG